MTIFQVRGTITTNNRSTQHHIDNGETDHKSSYSQKPPITYSKAPFQNLPSPTATSSRLMKFFLNGGLMDASGTGLCHEGVNVTRHLEIPITTLTTTYSFKTTLVVLLTI